MKETITIQLALEPDEPDALTRLRGDLAAPSFRDRLLADLVEVVHRAVTVGAGGGWEIEATLVTDGVASCPHGENPIFCVYCNLECAD